MEKEINWQLEAEIERHAYRSALQDIITTIHYREPASESELIDLIFRKAVRALSRQIKPLTEKDLILKNDLSDSTFYLVSLASTLVIGMVIGFAAASMPIGF